MRDIWNRNDGFNAGLNSPRENQQLLDGLAGHSDGSPYGELGRSVTVDPELPVRVRGSARSSKRSSGLGFGTVLGLVVVMMVLFGSLGDSPEKPAPAAAARQTVATPSSDSGRAGSRSSGSAAAVRSAAPSPVVVGTTLPQVVVPVIDRFALRRFNLTPGMPLDLFIRWQPSDGSARQATMDLSLITRDGRQARIPVAVGIAVRPGESVVQLALPTDTPAGKYELLGILSVAGESREAREVFTLVAPTTVSTQAVPAIPQIATQRPADSPPPDNQQPNATDKYLMHGGG